MSELGAAPHSFIAVPFDANSPRKVQCRVFGAQPYLKQAERVRLQKLLKFEASHVGQSGRAHARSFFCHIEQGLRRVEHADAPAMTGICSAEPKTRPG